MSIAWEIMLFIGTLVTKIQTFLLSRVKFPSQILTWQLVRSLHTKSSTVIKIECLGLSLRLTKQMDAAIKTVTKTHNFQSFVYTKTNIKHLTKKYCKRPHLHNLLTTTIINNTSFHTVRDVNRVPGTRVLKNLPDPKYSLPEVTAKRTTAVHC